DVVRLSEEVRAQSVEYVQCCVQVRVLRHVGGLCLLRADPSGGSCALAVEQAGPMCGPVNFWYPTDFAEKGPFFRGIVCPGLRGVPVGDGHSSKGFRDLTGRCSHRDLGLVIPSKSRPPANGGPVQGQS
ncbi:unnamed protein product, partial [Ixodes persulcatus]